jgi:release factor glutamine methyltransferase
MKTLLDILNASAAHLQKKGIAQPKRQAEEMLCDLFGLNRLELYLEFERPLTETELNQCRERLNRRANGEPLVYIHGQVEFYGCSLRITPAVLIPRQETEILVDKIAAELSQCDLEGKFLWDVCCGSGCIGIALKKRFPALQVTLSDLSEAALEIAAINAKRNEVDVQLLQGDLLAPFKGQKAHFFVCNPPYIAQKEYTDLEKEVRDFEPKLALVAGERGTEVYERLASDLPSYLHAKAKVWLEIGYQQDEALFELFKAAPWRDQKLEKDWSGHPRFFLLENE